MQLTTKTRIIIAIFIFTIASMNYNKTEPTQALTRPEIPVTPTATTIKEQHAIAYTAYRQAASIRPECQLEASLLAGIGFIESKHGTLTGASIASNGDTTKIIRGIALDGSNNTARILDTDNGVLDLDTEFDRAIGPMQFIPDSWERFGADGNNDGVKNPHNIFDASAAAANHLCGGGAVLNNEQSIRTAVLGYNKSNQYYNDVMEAQKFYKTLGV